MNLRREQYDRGYFDSAAYRGKSTSQRNRLRLSEILAHKPSGTLLEVGCGRGDFLALASTRFDVEGLDASQYAIEHAAPEVRGRIRKASVEEPLQLETSYDVIVALNVLEHLKTPGGVLARLIQHLAPGGVLFGSVPHNDQLLGKIHTRITNFFDRTHCSTFAPSAWLSLFQEAGFRKISFFGETMLGPHFASYVRSAVWRLVSLNMVFLCHR